jgi:hypothetical protein
MLKTIVSIAVVSIAAVAVPLGFAGGGKCGQKADPAATLVSTEGGSCTAKSVATGGCGEKTTLVSTDGAACTEKASAASTCGDKTKLVSTDGGACTEKASAASTCGDKTKLVSTDGAACSDKANACTEKTAACTDKTAASSSCCPGEAAKGATLVSTDGQVANGKPIDALRSLTGRWESTAKEGEIGHGGAVEFRVTSGGSVIVETMLPGQPHEMINTYAMDGDTLLLTHYCAIGNQPRMKLVESDGKTFKFEFLDATNLSSRDDMHMGALELTLDGPDRLVEKWTSFAEGKVAHVLEIEMKRAK